MFRCILCLLRPLQKLLQLQDDNSNNTKEHEEMSEIPYSR